MISRKTKNLLSDGSILEEFYKKKLLRENCWLFGVLFLIGLVVGLLVGR